jgi:hypothetical protein
MTFLKGKARYHTGLLTTALVGLFLMGSTASGHMGHFSPPDDVPTTDEPAPVGGTHTIKAGTGLGLNYTMSAFAADQGGICLNLEYTGVLHGYSGGCGFQSVPPEYVVDPRSAAIAITVDEMPAPVDGTIVTGVASRNVSKVEVSTVIMETIDDQKPEVITQNADIMRNANFPTNFFIAIMPGTGLTGTIEAENELGVILETLPLN